MASSMLLASRFACKRSSWEVASEARKDPASMVFFVRGWKLADFDLKLLPYLLGFRTGMLFRAEGPGTEERFRPGDAFLSASPLISNYVGSSSQHDFSTSTPTSCKSSH